MLRKRRKIYNSRKKQFKSNLIINNIYKLLIHKIFLQDVKVESKSYLTQLIRSFKEKTKKFTLLKDAYINSCKKRQAYLSCSRQIYAIILSFIREFQELKNVFDTSELTEENRKKVDEYNAKIDYYKTQIAKYSQILMSNEWDEKTELINEGIILEHKNILSNAKKNQDNIKIMETLLSLRLNALQTNPDFRKDFINELIKTDILFIKENQNNYI